MPDSLTANLLAGETSPYLLQHATNPVAWHPWNEKALSLARQHDRPILLSIGYSACHWCHVMAHESFEDPATAAVMNQLFVNIKVDREERPDLDQIYQAAHQMLSGRSGGWPLTMFLTPDGVPFHGGTYFPPTPRHGLPGFVALCEQIAKIWHSRRHEIDTQNKELQVALARQAALNAAPSPNEFDAQPLQALRGLLLGSLDRHYGGFGGAPKFPHPADIAFLLRRQNDATARAAACLTLDKMADGGIHDQLGGGFCRYSVDERWEIPHFEKMLYDNGPLLGIYADAWAATGNPRYREVAEGIVTWLQREMTAPTGAFFSSLDADSEGEEGRYYVWRREEVAALLGPEKSTLVARCWGLDGPPNFEGHWHLRRADAPTATEVPLLDAACQILLAARAQRVRPACDDKVLTSWNALMIEGLAHAARLLDRAAWLVPARAALDFLRERHWRDDRLLATSRHDTARLPAYLDDYAFLLAAVLEMLQAEFRSDDLVFASALADALLAHFEDKDAGGFFFTAHDHESLIQRPRSGHDNALPAGNAIAARALNRLGYMLGEMRYIDAAHRAVGAYWPDVRRQPGGFASLIQALEEQLVPPAIVVLRGPAGALLEWVRHLANVPAAVVLALPNGTSGVPPALAKPETPTACAWICRGLHCAAPLTELSAVEQLLRSG